MAYLAEAATIDIDDLRDDVDDGLHIAALAGVWTALTAGFGGMKHGESGLQFSPRLTAPLIRLDFGIRIGPQTLRIHVEPDQTSYTLSDGPALSIRHFDTPVLVESGAPLTLSTPPLADPGPPPSQPARRAPEDPGSRTR
jgi:alpha,alpha-trehalose phosphorylase